MERTVIQELAFPATAEDAPSVQFHSLTRPMDANGGTKQTLESSSGDKVGWGGGGGGVGEGDKQQT